MPLNLYAMASPLVEMVNPLTDATLRRYVGNRQDDDFSTVPIYEEIAVQIDVQALSTSDLQFVENIQQQSDMRAVYLRGNAGALNRPLQQGGDLLVFDGAEWLITQVLEQWEGEQWRKVICTRQLGPRPLLA